MNYTARINRLEQLIEPSDPDHYKWAAWLLLLDHGYLGTAFDLHDEGRETDFFRLLIYIVDHCRNCKSYVPDPLTKKHLVWAWAHTTRHKASMRQQHADMHRDRGWYDGPEHTIKPLPWIE